jgi:GT2 family glycosyltransferase
MKELITVVIANYNRSDDLRDALRSVIVQDYPNVEIIVVDNASQDNSREILAREFHDVVVLPLKENIAMDGYSVGFRCAQGKYIFQMDNDSLMPDAQTLTEVVKRFEKGPANLAVVATRVEECSNNLDLEHLRRQDRRKGPINTAGFHSGGVGFRKAILDRVGYYNRDVFLYGSELFLQMKFLAAGYAIRFYPEILMLHKSSSQARSSKGIYYEVRNRYWFLRHFGTSAYNVRFMPSMIIHDIIYSLFKRSPLAVLRAIYDGFGPLPDSLGTKQFSQQHDFIANIEELCSQFNLSSLWRRMRSHITLYLNKGPQII